MHIYFLRHSAICIKLDDTLLIFDYFKHKHGGSIKSGFISNSDILGAKHVYFFVSHSHPDHFNRCIFDWAYDHVRFILDDTVILSKMPQNVVLMHRGEVFQDDRLLVRAFGSTDIGSSYFVTCGGTSFFHAGDLNDWHWKDDGNVRYSRVMSRLFERELRYIQKQAESIDYAFFPVDKRMGSDFDSGADLFIKMIRPKHLIPIHFVDFTDTLAYSEKMKTSASIVLPVSKYGEKLL